MQADTPAVISVLTDLPNATCLWNSVNGGVMDDIASCDVDYLAPVADYDILNVRVKSECTSQAVRGQIKISIFP